MAKDVLVIGGGVAGIQAALDLGDMGTHVYLVEKSPTLGGRMAQLNKTFPTNDCSICILSPKMVDCFNHPNIDVLNYSEVVSVEGERGDFHVRVRRHATYVDQSKCTGCGDCTKECPVSVANEFDQGLVPRHAVYRPFMQAVPNTFVIDKKLSPCKAACPAETNVGGYVVLTAQGKFYEALELVKRSNPFPSICGRVCHRPCEKHCTRNKVDESLGIAYLKRFVGDWELEHEVALAPVPETEREERVAIVGAGPAGLTAAYKLALTGYKITVFEALPGLGGMLRYGIPAFRLSRDILDREINDIVKLGVEVRTGVTIGKDLSIDDLFQEGYKAVFLGVGAQIGKGLGVPGEDMEGVISALPLLRDVNLGKPVKVGEKVAIIGGGNAALDTARTALRLGAKEVSIVYRRSRIEMPAEPEWEIDETEREGVKLIYLAAPVRLIGENGKVRAMECIGMGLGAPDESGRRRPEPLPGSEFVMEVDMIIPAIGQEADASLLGGGLAVNKWGTYEVDPITLQTNREGIFAGGDAIRGAATVIEAIADGKRVAESVHRFLSGMDMREGREPIEREVAVVDTTGMRPTPRVPMPLLATERRKDNFDEVELGYDAEMAMAEAQRCLKCGVCVECLECVKLCGVGAIDHHMVDEYVDLDVGAIVVATGFDPYEPAELTQYGYKHLKNVITSLQYERLICLGGCGLGKAHGHLERPSDEKAPKTIGYIQCVGSRDVRRSRYCSAVCCMHATKQAMMAHEHDREVNSFVFYTDLRAFGRGFYEYTQRAEREYGTKYVRARVSRITEDADQNPVIWYEDTLTREVKQMTVDLVVLGVALTPRADAKALAEAVGVELDEYGFFKTDPYAPTDTTREGIYVCGYCESPKDIPESVAQASGAAARAAEAIMVMA